MVFGDKKVSQIPEIFASTGLKMSPDYKCILRDSVHKVYPNLKDNTDLQLWLTNTN